MATRCIHGEQFPCAQCSANRRHNEAATGRKLTEREFRGIYAMASLIFAWIQRGNGYDQFLAASPQELLLKGLDCLTLGPIWRSFPDRKRPVRLATILPTLQFCELSGDLPLDPARIGESMDENAADWYAAALKLWRQHGYEIEAGSQPP